MKVFVFTILSLFFFLGYYNQSQGQSYKNALGIRLGSYNGINFKTFLSSRKALDFNVSFRFYETTTSIRFTGLYQMHTPFTDVQGLNWYYGFGGSLGIEKEIKKEEGFLMSADGVLGLDYKFEKAPVVLAFDWRPKLQFSPGVDIRAGDFGLSVRYAF